MYLERKEMKKTRKANIISELSFFKGQKVKRAYWPNWDKPVMIIEKENKEVALVVPYAGNKKIPPGFMFMCFKDIYHLMRNDVGKDLNCIVD